MTKNKISEALANTDVMPKATAKRNKDKIVFDTDPGQTVKTDNRQVKNNAGGYVFALDDIKFAERFLILGAEGNNYYVSNTKQVIDAAQCLQRLINDGRGKELIDLAVDISVNGRAAKNDPAIFTLALAGASGNSEVVKYAYSKVNQVCRTATHLFTFADYSNDMRGWGESLKKTVAAWYENKSDKALATQALKYKQRNGWSHRDLFRVAHVKAKDENRNALYKYIVRGEKTPGVQLPSLIEAVERVQVDKTVAAAINAIEAGASWEMLPTELLRNVDIWEALIPTMGLTALVRNLGRFGNLEMLKPLSATSKNVIARLSDGEQLRSSRLHPANLLSALKVYASGRGERGELTWKANQAVVDALDESFYEAFKYVEPTGKNFLLGVDCSGSMFSASVLGLPRITAAEAAAVMAMAIMKKETNSYVMGFGHNNMGSLPISPSQCLDSVLTTMKKFNWGGTDCALPIIHADNHKMHVDVFTVITDNETWAGTTKPADALTRYRAKYKIDSKLVVIGTSVTNFTIADPADPFSMDMAGFDASAPQLITEFARI